MNMNQIASVQKNIIWFLSSKKHNIHKKWYWSDKSQDNLWQSERLTVFHS